MTHLKHDSPHTIFRTIGNVLPKQTTTDLDFPWLYYNGVYNAIMIYETYSPCKVAAMGTKISVTYGQSNLWWITTSDCYVGWIILKSDECDSRSITWLFIWSFWKGWSTSCLFFGISRSKQVAVLFLREIIFLVMLFLTDINTRDFSFTAFPICLFILNLNIINCWRKIARDSLDPLGVFHKSFLKASKLREVGLDGRIACLRSKTH